MHPSQSPSAPEIEQTVTPPAATPTACREALLHLIQVSEETGLYDVLDFDEDEDISES